MLREIQANLKEETDNYKASGGDRRVSHNSGLTLGIGIEVILVMDELTSHIQDDIQGACYLQMV